MSINLNSINLGLNSVQDVTDRLKEFSTFTYIDPDYIHFADDNPYSDNDTEEAIQDLAMSIDALGLIHPIVLNKKSNTEYALISGEKRYKAITTHLHWKSIPCMVFEGISDDKAQLMLHEANLSARQYTNEEKLTYYQKAKQYVDILIEKGEYKGGRQKKIADMLGVTTRQIRTYDTITENLSESDIEKVKSGDMSMNEAYSKANEFKKSGTASESNKSTLLHSNQKNAPKTEKKTEITVNETGFPLEQNFKMTDKQLAFIGEALYSLFQPLFCYIVKEFPSSYEVGKYLIKNYQYSDHTYSVETGDSCQFKFYSNLNHINLFLNGKKYFWSLWQTEIDYICRYYLRNCIPEEEILSMFYGEKED